MASVRRRISSAAIALAMQLVLMREGRLKEQGGNADAPVDAAPVVGDDQVQARGESNDVGVEHG